MSSEILVTVTFDEHKFYRELALHSTVTKELLEKLVADCTKIELDDILDAEIIE